MAAGVRLHLFTLQRLTDPGDDLLAHSAIRLALQQPQNDGAPLIYTPQTLCSVSVWQHSGLLSLFWKQVSIASCLPESGR